MCPGFQKGELDVSLISEKGLKVLQISDSVGGGIADF